MDQNVIYGQPLSSLIWAPPLSDIHSLQFHLLAVYTNNINIYTIEWDNIVFPLL